MTAAEIKEKISRDEYKGEKLISIFRLVLSVIYIASIPIISIIRNSEGYGHLPFRAHIFTNIFFFYSVFIFFYLRGKIILSGSLKYILTIIDITLISACIWTSCTYPEICPPIIFLSIQAQFFIMLILAGSLRYSVRCAYFSGVYSGFCYLLIIIVHGSVLDLPYFMIFESKHITVNFPLYNESFRIIAMIVAGAISGIACKRHMSLFSDMIETESAAADAASETVEQTRIMARTIQQSTDEIFLSSKNIFSTANNQSASVQEIESTINENTRIAAVIAEKTSNVAAIASKMENDVSSGFSVLKRNVGQLEEIKNENDGVISGITALGNKILKIRDIITVINTITDQTKVIAFNAALEAASAGEYGKRFSVVSSEVNRLADDISALTKQIREQVKEMQSSSSSLIVSGEKSAEKITQGNNLIKELEDIFMEIRTGAAQTSAQAQTITVSTQQQQKSSEQINVAIAGISAGLSSFIQSTKVATSSAKNLSEIIQKLETVLAKKTETESNT